MKNFYFTFGKIHKTSEGESLGDCYCSVYADNRDQAREKMFKARGNEWAAVYESMEDAGVQRFKLRQTRLEFIRLY